MTTKQVADRLVELCRTGQIHQAQQELYADNIVCVEAPSSPMGTTTGKPAVLEKGKMFADMIEERHGGSFSDPLVNGQHFSVAITLDATMKGRGRQVLEEICTYEVKDGKVVREQFFY